MKNKDNLGARMKAFYEEVPKTKLIRRTPVAIRIDGKAFHTFTKGMMKPFDTLLTESMQETMKYLCESIPGCVLGYTQSDEITLILVDYKNINSSAWFDYEVQKMTSVAASMATLAFNRAFNEIFTKLIVKTFNDKTPLSNNIFDTYKRAIKKGALFDARVFNIPKEEVTNLIYWRELDAMRNSVSSVGQSIFSQKELNGKTSEEIKKMLLDNNYNWENLPIYLQRGSCCTKIGYQAKSVNVKDGFCERHKWIIDKEIPIFKDKSREYIEKLIN